MTACTGSDERVDVGFGRRLEFGRLDGTSIRSRSDGMREVETESRAERVKEAGFSHDLVRGSRNDQPPCPSLRKASKDSRSTASTSKG